MTFSNKVSWTLDPQKCALLIHDMQPHYLRALPPGHAQQTVQAVRTVAHACKQSGIPIFVSHVPPARNSKERGLMLDMWGAGPTPGQHAPDPAIGLPDEDIHPLAKRSYSAFFASGLEIMLRRLGLDTLVIAGIYTSIGCYLSAADAFARDIRAFLVADATDDMSTADHEAGLALAARTCACIIQSSGLLDAISQQTRPQR